MTTVLCISSQVVRGSVGATAARSALERLGHEVWVLPTVTLSSHRGHARVAGPVLPADELRAMLDALDANGWLGEVGAVLIGYLPDAAQVGVAFDAIGRVRAANRTARVLCDPAIGDTPKGLYVDAAAAEATRDRLLPMADIATPNAFELAWLTGRRVTGPEEALAAAAVLGPETVLATSIPSMRDRALVNLLREPGSAWTTRVAARVRAPHGTGDFLAALLLGHLLNGRSGREALALATAGIEAALDVSEGADALKLAGSGEAWSAPAPWPVAPVGA